MIKGLTFGLNEAGKLKIGGKGPAITSTGGTTFKPPVKYDHVKITTMERDADGDYILDTALMEAIKKSKNCLVNQNGDLVGIPIRLLYNDPDLNFYTKYASYVGSALSCYGDGEKSFKLMTEYKQETPCPCPRIESGYDGKDKCKFSGTLTCLIDEAGMLGQAHKFRTTSKNTVLSILGGINLIQTATRGRIAGLPLMLTLNPKATTTPGGIPTIVYVMSICYRGSMADLRQETLAIGQEEQQYLIGMDTIEERAKRSLLLPESKEEASDFASEFFPDNTGNTGTPGGAEDIIDIEGGETSPVVTGSVEAAGTGTVNKVVTGEVTGDGTGNSAGEIKEDAEKTIGDIPVGPYAKIYEGLLTETDFDKAIAMVKRLQKNNIIYWIAQNYPDAGLDPSLKKPELVSFAEAILTTVLGKSEAGETETVTEKEAVVTNPTTPGSTTTTAATTTTPEAKEAATKTPQKWDDSGPVLKPQLRRMVELKLELEKSGTLKPTLMAWTNCVNYFLDANGTPIDKAAKLTTKQCEGFIAMLETSRIPF